MTGHRYASFHFPCEATGVLALTFVARTFKPSFALLCQAISAQIYLIAMAAMAARAILWALPLSLTGMRMEIDHLLTDCSRLEPPPENLEIWKEKVDHLLCDQYPSFGLQKDLSVLPKAWATTW